jgi:translation elongation factor EF-1beta
MSVVLITGANGQLGQSFYSIANDFSDINFYFRNSKELDITNDEQVTEIFNEIKQEGLFWKTEYKKEPVAFGIYKLIVGFSCEDEKVSVDDIVEQIEAFDEFVQSVEISSFNKI